MVRRHSTSKPAALQSEFKTGDVIWAPYRKIPEWPSVVRCVYPKKVTYVFLPYDEAHVPMSSIFSAPPNKIRPFTSSDSLPANARNDMREAYRAAVELLKKKGIYNEDEAKAAEAMTHIGGDSFPKQTGTQQRKETEAESTVENSNAGPVVWNVGDVAWLCAENHTEWPCVIREIKKKYAMVDVFPLKFNAKTERYPLSACQKFELNGRSLETAIRKERNYELRLALQSVEKYFRRSGMEDRSETTTDNDSYKADTEKEDSQKRNDCNVSGIEEEDDSVGVTVEEDKFNEKADVIEKDVKREGKRAAMNQPAPAKRAKFSEIVKHLEIELSEKVENLEKGDLAWINRARSGRIVKWPILILKVDNANKSCICTELPLDEPTVTYQWCLNSEKTRVVQMSNIYCYDTFAMKIEDIDDSEMKTAVQQAEDIAEGKYRPFEETFTDSDRNGKVSIKENGCKTGSSNELAPSEILRLCKSDNCSRHLMAIWNGQFQCARHSCYIPPAIPPLHFDLDIGDILPESDAVALVEHLDGTITKYKDAMKSSLRRLHYITSVAVPEAIIFAITQIRYCSGSEAVELFENAKIKKEDNGPKESKDTSGAPATASFEQLLKVASKVRSATLGMD